MSAAAAAGAGVLDEIELDLVAEGISRRYGYDLRGFEPSLYRAALSRRMAEERVASPLAFLERALRDASFLERLLAEVTRRDEALFHPAAYYRALRKKVAPHLRTYPSVKVWSMGCTTGAEVWSLAILLREELRRPFRVYATEIHDALLEGARAASFPKAGLSKVARDYERAGGGLDFGRYHAGENGSRVIDLSLRKCAVFASHYPVTDGPFNEFHLIVCRDTLGKLAPELRARVFNLMHESLRTFGYLSLGAGDAIEEVAPAGRYRVLDARQRLYQKTRS